MNEIYNAAAERSILAGIIKGGYDTFLETEDILKTEFFFQESSQAIWKVIKRIYEKDVKLKPDITTILSTAHEIGLANFFADKNNVTYLRAVTNLDFSPENIRDEAKKVAKLGIARTLANKTDEIKQELHKINGTEPTSHIFAIAEDRISEVQNSFQEDGAKTELMGTGGEQWLENILNNPRTSAGISTGFPIHDAAIGGGLRRKTVSLIAARAKRGKTSVGDGAGLHIAGNLNIPTLNVDTEMDRESHLARICANLTGIPINKVETGQVSQHEKQKLREALKKIENMPYFYRCVAGYEFEDILSIIKRWVLKDVGKENGVTRDCVIIYDYFKLMSANQLDFMQETQALGFQLSSLNNFAIKYDVPILSFAQTNRDGASEVDITTIACSDRLSWFATSVSIFKDKTPEEITQDGIENGNRKLVPLVARYGPCLEPDDYINMNMRGEYCKITELGTRNQALLNKKEEGFEVEDAI